MYATRAATRQVGCLNARIVSRAKSTMTVIRRRSVLLVSLANTQHLHRHSARHAWVVGPILTETLRQCVKTALKVTTLVLV
jgi:hypothetical protein